MLLSPLIVRSCVVACLLPISTLLASSAESAEGSKMTYTYKKAGDVEIKADVYPAAGEKRPVVVWIHGGALINGHRESVPGWLAEACRKQEYDRDTG